jgi:NAD(P)H-dependent FMN reductase
MPRLLVIIGSTRPGRVGLPVATWFAAAARSHGAFDVEVADLADIGLPLMDEPHHPRRRDYQHEHTKAWSARVEAADAFAFVTCEYNAGPPAALKNAIDYLSHEWSYRPATIVSYGGVSAGLRAATQLKQNLQMLSVPVVTQSVSIPFVQQFLDDDGVLEPNDVMEQAVGSTLDELARWEQAMRELRDSPSA